MDLGTHQVYIHYQRRRWWVNPYTDGFLTSTITTISCFHVVSEMQSSHLLAGDKPTIAPPTVTVTTKPHEAITGKGALRLRVSD